MRRRRSHRSRSARSFDWSAHRAEDRPERVETRPIFTLGAAGGLARGRGDPVGGRVEEPRASRPRTVRTDQYELSLRRECAACERQLL
eukprot:872842-Prymnesium_polylepis.1